MKYIKNFTLKSNDSPNTDKGWFWYETCVYKNGSQYYLQQHFISWTIQDVWSILWSISSRTLHRKWLRKTKQEIITCDLYGYLTEINYIIKMYPILFVWGHFFWSMSSIVNYNEILNVVFPPFNILNYNIPFINYDGHIIYSLKIQKSQTRTLIFTLLTCMSEWCLTSMQIYIFKLHNDHLYHFCLNMRLMHLKSYIREKCDQQFDPDQRNDL